MKMNMEKKTCRASLVLPNLLAETLYDSVSKKTYFAVSENGAIRTEDFISTPQGDIHPLDGQSDIISKNVVLLPSAATEYVTVEELLEEVQAFIHKRVDISASFERIAAQYVFLTWIYDRLNELPYLRARGDYGSGKSRFLRVVGSICYRPIFTAGATTTSPIFRILDQVHGTLILDEADLVHSDSRSDIVKILNTGYQKGTAVLRSEGKGIFEVRSYDVYGPKIVATRQNFDDQALESRFLIEDMGRSKLRSYIPIRLDDAFSDEAKKLRNKLLMWRFRNYYTPLVFDEKPIEGLHPRLQQIIIPLLAVMPNPEIQETLIAHARRYNEELIADRALSWESEVVLAILRLHEDSRLDGLLVKDIAAEVNSDFESGESLTPKKVGWILRAKLQLKASRTNKGFALSVSRNQERLELWRERLGITDSDIRGEEVNDVNIVNVIEQSFDEADIPFGDPTPTS
jgi:hypothetical protein